MLIPHLVAHRGYTLRYPENTLVGIEAAIQAGARHVEVDVQLSRDGVPFLFHDHSLGRVCQVDGAIHDFPAQQLLTFSAAESDRLGDAFSKVPLATLTDLADCLHRHPGVTAFVELKPITVKNFGAERVLVTLRKCLQAVVPQCVLISFDLDALAIAKSSGWPRFGAVINHWRKRKSRMLEALKPDYLFCDVVGLPSKGKLVFGDSKLAAYEVADADLALSLAARGVEYIETFAVAELMQELRMINE